MSRRQQHRTAHGAQPQPCITLSPPLLLLLSPNNPKKTGQSENKPSSSRANMPKLGMPA